MKELDTLDFTLIGELEFAEVFRNENSTILIVAYKKDMTIELQQAKELVTFVYQLDLSSYTGIAVYAAHPQFSISGEARKHFGKHPILKSFKKQAIITTNLSTVLLASFFIKKEKPIITTKVFKKIKSSIEWLSAK